jgi:elongation factor Ts
MANTELIKELRDKTQMSIKEIKKALEQAGDDIGKALEFLKEQGAKIAEKRSERETGQGVIEAYIHGNGKMGVLVDLRSETDFVAKNEQFKQLAHNIAMQIASMNPKDVDELMSQPFVKDQDLTIDELIKEYIGKLGENIKVERFTRFSL